MEGYKPVKKADIHARRLGEEWILYDSESEKVHIINKTAELVWRFCDGNHDVASIKDQMQDIFNASESRIEGDVQNILEEFKQIGILEDA